ncbi:MAG: helicase-related protein [Methylacidiphilales bacterium]|nr:helicase-related protein [Candidatus Methylacidiphilales bacterium]
MGNKIIDNKRLRLVDFLNKHAGSFKDLSIATGYWDLPGMHSVIDAISSYKKIRLLIGQEPVSPRYKSKDEYSQPYPEIDIFKDLSMLEHDPKYKKLITDIKNMIDAGVLEVKLFRESFMHAKCYILGNAKDERPIGIIGSSNFTYNGLHSNIELNNAEDQTQIIKFRPQSETDPPGHLYWFEEMWNDSRSVSWDGKFKQLLEESPVGDMLFSPYETYIRTLYELYSDEIEGAPLQFNFATGIDLLAFQNINVQHLIKKLNKYKVAMLADSVGLGKTITAIGVIQQYRNSKEGRKRVVVICPKSIKEQWKYELLSNNIELTPIVLQNSNAIQEEMQLDAIASVSLFVIDESHNLRRTGGERYLKLLQWIKQNPNAHVMLLTATPINNELKDISNQFLLGTRGYGDLLKVHVQNSKTGKTTTKDFVKVIEELEKKLKKNISMNKPIDYQEIRKVIGPIIRSVVVRRTRQGIIREYGKLKINGKDVGFPESTPKNHPYQLSHELLKKLLSLSSEKFDLKFLYSKNPEEIIEYCDNLKHPLDQLELVPNQISESELQNESPIYFVYQLILLLGFVPYRWRIYYNEYYGKSPEQIAELALPGDKSRELQQQRGIYGIFRTMFLKRMESSAFAISKSIDKYEKKLKMFHNGIKNNIIEGIEDDENYKEALRDDEDEILEEIEDTLSEKQLKVLATIDVNQFNIPALLADIEKEYELIRIIRLQLQFFNNNDAKLNELKKLLTRISTDKPEGNNKVLVFSYFADTVQYLETELSKSFLKPDQAAFITSANRSKANHYASLFSPNSKKYQFKADQQELQFLFTTDVLAEGHNLQDCGVIINYDLHWNPVRMIQRNGRINRLGSPFNEVFIYNMSPQTKLEYYLQLVKRLEGKISMINNTIGNDQSVLGEVANPIEYIESLKELYSDNEKVRKGAFEQLEETGDFMSVEDDYILDLKKFYNDPSITEEYKKKIFGIADGKWAKLPTHLSHDHEVVVLARLYKDNILQIPQFIAINPNDATNDSTISFLPLLDALQLIKTNPENNRKESDKITLDKRAIKNQASNPEYYENKVKNPSHAKGTKKEVIDILYNKYHHSPETIQMVQQAFVTTNHIEKKEIDSLVRAIIQNEKQQKNNTKYINSLITIAKNLNDSEISVIKPDKAEVVIYYAAKNS